jgi:aquaglyceroporin related protein
VDPRYYEFNPTYQRTENAPVWGLAKPLPRVVRPGMWRGRDGQQVVEVKEAERQEPGGAEAIPQLGMIYEQRQEAGKDAVHDGRDVDERGYGHERIPTKTSERSTQILGSENSVVDRYGTPRDERSNPLEEWRSGGTSNGRNHSDPFGDQNTDLGDRRLPSVQEVPSAACSVSVMGDANDVDLEARGKAEEWAIDQDEAEQYTQEAYDDHNSWSCIRAKFREPLAECLAVSSSFKATILFARSSL